MNRSLIPFLKPFPVSLALCLVCATACSSTGGGSSPASTQYCFSSSSDSFTGWLEWRENKAGQIAGEVLARVRQTNPDYAADYTTQFVGTPVSTTSQAPRKYRVKTRTEIDGQVQVRDEVWVYNGESVQTGAQLYESRDCATRP